MYISNIAYILDTYRTHIREKMSAIYDTYIQTARNAHAGLGNNTIVAFQLEDDAYHIMETEGDGVDIRRVAEIWAEGSLVDRDGTLEICIPVHDKRRMVDLFRAHGYNVVVVPQPFLGGIKEGDDMVEQNTCLLRNTPEYSPSLNSLSPTARTTMSATDAIYTDYEAKVLDARRLFGNEDMVVLYRVGDFYQILSIDDGLVDIHALAERLKTNVCKFRRADPIVSRDNFLMMGWPVEFNDRMVARLRAHGYAVVGIKKGDTHVEQYPESTSSLTPRTTATMYDTYATKVLDARDRFGPNTQVVYQVGLFFQILSIDDGLVDIHHISSILNTRIAKLHRQNPIVCRDNWLMMGWPEAQNELMVARLRAHGYPVVVVKRTPQDTHEEVFLTDSVTSIRIRHYTNYETKTLQARGRWGAKAVVVYKVGEFYQMMSIEDGLVDIRVLAELLNCRITKCDKANPIVDRDNCLMIGWPILSNDRMVAKLRAHDYHVVMVPEQL